MKSDTEMEKIFMS